MSDRTSVELLIRRDRWIVGAALALAVALCWAWLVPMAQELKREGMMCGVASWGAVATWTGGHVIMLFAMWSVMMAGMMLPSAAPILLLYGCVVRKSPGIERPAAHVYAFAAGYLVLWSAFSAVATGLQAALTDALLLSPLMASQSPVFAGVMLLLTGLYQLTPWKHACLAACRAPVEFLTRHWRPGVAGGFRLGAAHGLYCVGCCWALMLLLFVGGVMNLAWIALLTLLVLLEKAAPFGTLAGRGAGVICIVAGMWVLAASVASA